MKVKILISVPEKELVEKDFWRTNIDFIHTSGREPLIKTKNVYRYNWDDPNGKGRSLVGIHSNELTTVWKCVEVELENIFMGDLLFAKQRNKSNEFVLAHVLLTAEPFPVNIYYRFKGNGILEGYQYDKIDVNW